MSADQIADQIKQVERDLAEVAAQRDAGELDDATAERLAAAYEAERVAVVATAAVVEDPEASGRSRLRLLLGAAILGVGIVTIAIIGVFSLQEGPTDEITEGIPSEVLGGEAGADLSSISNEEMEAVVAANPGIIGMRLALAERYVQAGDHPSALAHYLVVLDQDADRPEALAMVGWLSFLSGEPALAESFITRALEVEPNYPQALWFLANVRASSGDDQGAIEAIELLFAYDLSPEVKAAADQLLAEVSS
jgi:tetratricopeptide (TPR) repeat protein